MEVIMARIQWSSSTINSFFSTSLNQKSTPMDGIYNSLGDAAMIKRGAYSKLMKAYYAEMKKKNDTTTEKETTDSKKDKKNTTTYDSTGKKTETKESVLDKLI